MNYLISENIKINSKQALHAITSKQHDQELQNILLSEGIQPLDSYSLDKNGRAGQRRLKNETGTIPNIQRLNFVQVFEKYLKYSFPHPYEGLNKYPPEVKACMAGDKEAIKTFLTHGFDLNRFQHPYERRNCSVLEIVFNIYEGPMWGNQSYGLGKINPAEMLSFLIENGADVNKIGLLPVIKWLKSHEDQGVNAVKVAIRHGADLKGILRIILLTKDLPEWNNSQSYIDKIISILIEEEAKS